MWEYYKLSGEYISDNDYYCAVSQQTLENMGKGDWELVWANPTFTHLVFKRQKSQ